MERIYSGIESLDISLGGGFPVGYNFVLSGDIGTAKSVFTHNIVHNHLNTGGAGIYVLTNRSPENILEEAKEFEWDFNKHINKGLHILDCFSAKTGSSERLSIDRLTHLSIALENKRQELIPFGRTLQIFDSASDIFINNDAKDSTRFIESACARALKTGSIALFLFDTESQSEKDLSAIKSVTQGTIEMKTQKDKNLLRVVKLVGLPFKNNWMEYNPLSKRE